MGKRKAKGQAEDFGGVKEEPGLLSLPTEVLELVLRNLDSKTLATISLCSKFFRARGPGYLRLVEKAAMEQVCRPPPMNDNESLLACMSNAAHNHGLWLQVVKRNVERPTRWRLVRVGCLV